MKAVSAKLGALVVDSDPYSVGGSAAVAQAMRAEGVDCLIGYLGAITSARVGFLHDAGIAFMPVTFADQFDPRTAVTQLHALDYPEGAHVWLDTENTNLPANAPVDGLVQQIDAWAAGIAAAGYIPAGYFGVPQPFTSDELFQLSVKLYWRGQGSVRDRHDALAEPKCGWSMTQSWPSVMCGGLEVDKQILGRDYFKRSAVWAVGD